MFKKEPTPPILQFFGDYRFLSNFWYASFVWKDIRWASTELAYQAAKSNDPAVWAEMAQLTPGQAKRYGKTVEMREDWEEVKFGIMYEIVRCKFEQNPDLLQKLLDTGDARLEEGNHWGDRIWGVCPAGSGNGKNWLGEILMDIRREYQLGFET